MGRASVPSPPRKAEYQMQIELSICKASDIFRDAGGVFALGYGVISGSIKRLSWFRIGWYNSAIFLATCHSILR